MIAQDMRLGMSMGLSVDTRPCRMATILIIWSTDISIILTTVIAMTMAR
jgi:hypothetical protein